MLIDTKKLSKYILEEKILEFENDQKCMDYFNIYDFQNFKSIKEMKEFQGKYGFNIGKRRYHIDYDDALDVYIKKENYFMKGIDTEEDGRF